jgi:predicted nuclease of restriction endonuclease-like (RecB) superfamily
MRQFYEAYRSNRRVSPLVRQLPWTHHLIILSQAKPVETREFYLLAAIKERWPKRELERQIRSGAVLREASATKKVSPAVRQTHPTAIDEFKNAYNVEFLGLAAEHSEADLHGALLRNLGRFLTELGRDFCFVGSQYPVQVGNQDFSIDLVFFHRSLQCLVAFELKVDKFKPADPGATLVLRRGARPQREEATRTGIHRRAALRDEGRRGRRVRARAHDFAHARRRVPDVPAAEGSAPREAP